jgi:hypothetical protein
MKETRQKSLPRLIVMGLVEVGKFTLREETEKIWISSRNRENDFHPSSRTPGPVIRTLAIEISPKAYLGAISEFRSDGEW